MYLGPVEIRGFGTPGESVIAYPHPQVRIANGVTEFLHRDALNSVRATSGPPT